MHNIQHKPINYLCIYYVVLQKLNYTILAMVVIIVQYSFHNKKWFNF